MTLRELGREAAVDHTYLHRIEKGERTSVGVDLLSRIARPLGLEISQLVEAAGLVSPAVVRAVADPELARAFTGQSLNPDTREALRRLHLADLAGEWVRTTGQAGRVPVDPSLVLRGFSITTRKKKGAKPGVAFDGNHSVVIDSSLPSWKNRFLLAHAAGHAALGHPFTCQIENPSPIEMDASVFAEFLLTPRTALKPALLQTAGDYDLWEPGDLSFLSEIAGRFDIPLWVVVRRVGEVIAEVALE
jgi:transcriptional regulator with XRE-family HTH domain